MDKLYDITALGELLIDFAMNGQSEQGNNLFEACPGGAPCNVLAMLNKLGRKAAFIGNAEYHALGARNAVIAASARHNPQRHFAREHSDSKQQKDQAHRLRRGVYI